MYLLVVVGNGMKCNLSIVLYNLLLSALEALTLHGSTSVLLSIRRSLAIRLHGGPYFSVFIGSYWEWNDVQPLSSPL